MLETLARATIRWRVPIVAVVVVLTALSVYLLPRVRIDADYLNYLPPDDPAVQLFKEVGDQFGGTFIAMIALETPDVFSSESLTEIRRFTRAAEGLEGVREVVSLTNILDIRENESGDLQVGRLIDREVIPTESDELASLRDYVLSKEMYRESLVSADGQVALIMCRLDLNADKIEVGRALRRTAAETIQSARVSFGGIPMMMDYSMRVIVRDMATLIPIVIVVVLLTLFVGFRTLRGVVLPLLVVMVATLWTLAIMALLDRPLTLISAIMPVVLIATGTAYGIHLLNRHREIVAGNRSGHKGKREDIVRTVATIGMPIVITGLTTLAGFSSMRASSMVIFQDFGTFTAVGVLFAFILTIVLLPAILSWLPYPNPTRIQRDASGRLPLLLGRVGRSVPRRKGWILGGVVAMFAVAAVAIPSLSREIDIMAFFEADSEPRVADDLLRNRFGGSNPLIVRVDGDPSEPYVLRTLQALERRLGQLPELGRPQSYADLIEEMSDVMLGHGTVPETRRGLSSLALFLEGEEILRQLVDHDQQQLVVQVNMRNLDSEVIEDTLTEVERILAEEIARDVVVVDSPAPEQDGYDELIGLRAAQIAVEVEAEINRRSPAAVSREDLIPVIRFVLERETDDFIFATQRRDVVAAVNSYLRSDLAEAELDESSVIMVGRALEGTARDEEGLAILLRETLPTSVIEEDPLLVDDLAWSLSGIIGDELNELRVRSLQSSVVALLPGGLATDSALIDDIESVLWAANDRTIGVPYDQYVSLFGAPDADAHRVQTDFSLIGIPVIVLKLNRLLVGSQLKSLIAALGVVVLLLGLQLRSFIGGLMAAFPIVITIALNFTLMRALDIPLDTATAIIAGVAIGIGIDYTVHFIYGYRKELADHVPPEKAVETATKTVGRAILINTATVMAGFLVLYFSAIIALQRFGWLTALTMIVSALGALIVFPAMALVFKPKFLFGMHTDNQRSEEIAES